MTELPTTFGKYYLTEKLATGGMAEIYLAKLIGPGGFEKQLVIKQIHPKLTGQRHFVDLFVAEAKTLVALAHGNIVPVYELGVVEDTYFIAMDYIDGPTLYRLTEVMAGRDALMEPGDAAWIAARILEGLDYAHRKGEGVIHRDLSPRNVMLSRDGEVKLVDFGIAVTLGDPGETNSEQSAPTGSFPYMSPEQVRREPLTGQTDLFSVGVLFWEMLTGKRLFARPEADATLAAVLNAEIPRPSSVRAGISDKLDDIVMRALERDKAARWQDAAEMLTALNKYIYSLETTPTARDVAALVAKYCPPQTRRLPTHLEAASVPHEGAAQGKKKKRHQTFATNVELQGMLERATPMFGVAAIQDEPEPSRGPSTKVIPRPSQQSAAEPEPAPSESTRVRARAVHPDLPTLANGEPRPGVIAPRIMAGGKPSRGFLVFLGLGAIAVSIAAVVLFFKFRDRVMLTSDAAIDVAVDARALDAPADAAELDAPIDAPVVADVVDAAPVVARPDAARAPRVDAAIDSPRPAGTAKLAIGADPWGKVFVDGKPRGTAPIEIEVTAGKHTVEIVFDAESPPRKQTFFVDLAAGETKPITVDFH